MSEYHVTTLVGEESSLNIERLHVAFLDDETAAEFQKSLRSVLGKVAWRLSLKDQPCGPWFLDGKAALLSPQPIPKTSVTFPWGNGERSVTVLPSDRVDEPNLWDPSYRSALASILNTRLRQALEKHEHIQFRYERGGGLLTLTNPAVLAEHWPDWAPKPKPKEVEALWNFPHVPFFRGTKIRILEPYRYIDFNPGIGLLGQPLLRYGFSTRMETNAQFNLGLLLGKTDWSVAYDNPRFVFRIAFPGTTPKVHADTGTWLVKRILTSNFKEAELDGISAEKRFVAFLDGYGVRAEHISEHAGDVAVLVERYAWEEEVEKLIVPAGLLVPTVDFGNAYFYSQFSSTDLDKAYSHLTQVLTSTKAAMLEAIGSYLAKTIHATLETEAGTRRIRFGNGAWANRDNGKTASPRDSLERLAGQPSLFPLKTPRALLRRGDVFFPINLAEMTLGQDEEVPREAAKRKGLMGYLYQGEFKVYRSAPQLAQGLKLAIVAPFQRTGGQRPVVADMLPPTFRFDVDGVLPKSSRLAPRAMGKVHSLKNLDVWFERMQNFFQAKPMDAFFQPVGGDRDDPQAYEDAMAAAQGQGAQAYIVILPLGMPQWKQDAIYMRTCRFGFYNNRPVVHFREGNWKRDPVFYSMLYVALAKLNTRLGGLNFKIDLSETVPFLQDYSNVLIVGYDFGRRSKDYLGVITATDVATQNLETHRTHEIVSPKDAVKELDQLLGNLVRDHKPELLVVMRDSKFANREARGLHLHYESYGVDTLPIETLKSGGVSGFRVTRVGRGRGAKVTTPYGYAFYTPDMHINVFGSSSQIHAGVWNAIRFAVSPRPFPLDLEFDYEDVANLGFGLSKMGGYFADPSKTKYPDILARADKLIDLYQGGALAGVNREVNAREFDP